MATAIVSWAGLIMQESCAHFAEAQRVYDEHGYKEKAERLRKEVAEKLSGSPS